MALRTLILAAGVGAGHNQAAGAIDRALNHIPEAGDVKRIDILETTGQVLRVSPWFENLGKRLVKTPKLFFADSGLTEARFRKTGNQSGRARPGRRGSASGETLGPIRSPGGMGKTRHGPPCRGVIMIMAEGPKASRKKH